MKAQDYVSPLERTGHVLTDPLHQMQSSATTLLCDFEQQRDFSCAITNRASKVFGPFSSHRITQILPAIRSASRPTRPGSVVELNRVMCNGF